MEGVPEWVDPAQTGERVERAPWQARGNELLELAGQLVPGLALALALASLGHTLSGRIGGWLGLEASPLSPILVAILLGLALRNLLGLPRVYEAGLQLALRRVLRVGVALLGLRLSLGAVGELGLLALPVVAATIASALLLVGAVNRLLGLPRRLGTLVAVGTAICGNTAIVATAPAIGADEDEISYAVGCITVFGLLALLGYPFLAHGLFGADPRLAGLFLGTAIHDTAQVVGAGLLYLQQFGAPEALDAATVTKLVRNVFMVAVIPLVALRYRRAERAGAPAGRPALGQAVPLFVLGFVALALLRTLGDLGAAPVGGLLSEASWEGLIGSLTALSSWCLTVAMASVGLGTHFARLRALGLRPLAVGLAAALSVGSVSALVLHGLAALGGP
jgi:uncharacterized integral membrane protein (TIGR00698 family)